MPDTIPSEALSQPLYVNDAAALSAKLDCPGGLLREYWDDYQNRILEEPSLRSQMIFLPALLSGEFGEEAGDELRNYYRALAESDCAGDVQFHTWCRGGSVTRRVAFFDWLAHREHWQAADIEEAAEAFLGFAFKHSYQVLTVRRRASDNQALSMTLNCAVTGFIFGHKLGDHPTGKFLFEYGMSRLPDMIGLFPGDGYGGEGSTYTSHVNTPLAYWTAEFLRQVTGKDPLDTPFQPNQTTLRKMLEMELRLVSPGGLLAPWDHYGWQEAINASAFAYLAKATNNPRYLSLIPALGTWKNEGYLAWGQDDPMWTLLWWPEQYRDFDERELPEDLFSWFLPKTGAALDDCGRRSRLMQVWDLSATTMAGVGRGQVNPNHLILEYGGEPVFQDGVPDRDAAVDPFNYPQEKVLAGMSDSERGRYSKYLCGITGAEADWGGIIRGISPGLLGASNSIVIDREPWYWPGETRVGEPEFYGKVPGFQVVTADAASFYRPHYDVKRVRRTSLWADAGFGIVLDTVEAEAPHHWTWQVYTRPEVQFDAGSARIGLPEGSSPGGNSPGGSSVLLAWASGPEASIEAVPGYPHTHERRSQKLSLELDGQLAQFSLVIAPDAKSASIERNGSLLVVSVDGQRHELVVENFEGQLLQVGGKETKAAFALSHNGALHEVGRNQVPRFQPDENEHEDIVEECDFQVDEFRQVTAWETRPREAGRSRLSQVDAILAQLRSQEPSEAFLLEALETGEWPVQAAAAEVLGRLGCARAAPRLRRMLEKEHAIPEAELYPGDETSGEGPAKRWRLKAALIVALGKLNDRETVPLLARIIADSRDFYGVYSVAAQALGRIGGEEAKRALAPILDEVEINTFMRARDALKVIEAGG